jgi:ABC-type multidrug transport system fused ATPase/permease subunit
LQAVSAIVTALAIAFSSGWKLTLVVLCFVPLLMLNGILYGRTQGKDSFTEQGGQVLNKPHYFMYL